MTYLLHFFLTIPGILASPLFRTFPFYLLLWDTAFLSILWIAKTQCLFFLQTFQQQTNRSILQLDCNLCVGCKKTNIGGWIRDPSVSFIKVSHCLLATKISTKRMIHPWTSSAPRLEVCMNGARSNNNDIHFLHVLINCWRMYERCSDNDLQMQCLNF